MATILNPIFELTSIFIIVFCPNQNPSIPQNWVNVMS